MALHFDMALAPWAAAGAGRIQTREQVRKSKLVYARAF